MYESGTIIMIRKLPPELQLHITSYLPPLLRHMLSLTCQYFHALIGPIRLSREDTFFLRLQQENSDPDRYHRVCSKCLRLRQFYHFSVSQAGSQTKAAMRTCMDCYLKIYNAQDPRLIKWFFGVWMANCQKCNRLVRCDYDDSMDKRFVCVPALLRSHTCPGEKTKDQAATKSQEPFVNAIRDSIDRLEAQLPPRFLLMFKPDRHSHRKDTEVDEIIKKLAEFTVNKGQHKNTDGP